ncbi:non-canonical purine NTP pyrophosphatase [Candidatus Kaiserbacteria bacterium CG10_big_fil_rev_8_21_14_0_10_56_12]|uniref:Non-canonical purine NTP pyrophosphatase n=1 Tax=Candidatus Kaiserbacteria bacterium CG10_big_fil_rev_8_21_14_0_10_56_12 TaxID=1974611 RepID=A0A2H0U955_9BACT|nr:MAG: non-canonical purine NTP pyrophosphatase [Candidatus Kaiserbacteria bacterium CG10_big_fil_rev_8_21_14_0_10_56_12]
MTIRFITESKNKLAEMQAILGDVEQLDIDLPEIQEIDAHKIVRAKPEEALKHKKVAFIVEDTSLYLDALNGLPGPLIKWFMKTIGNAGIAKIAEAFANSGAEAKTIIGYADGSGNIEFFEGSIRGSIVSPRGETTFGWDPIFQPEGSDKTFAELSADEKNALSMRRRAAEKLRDYLNLATP